MIKIDRQTYVLLSALSSCPEHNAFLSVARHSGSVDDSVGCLSFVLLLNIGILSIRTVATSSAAMASNIKLPDICGYSNSNCLIPWKRLDSRKHLRILRGDKSASIKHAINWVYSSGLFPRYTDYYAAAAWAILAHGLVCEYGGVPTSEWMYDLPRDWKISTTEMQDRVNRAFLNIPAVNDLIIAPKAVWWCIGCALNRDSPLISRLGSLGVSNDFAEVMDVIGHWASTRKVLSLGGVKGIIEESDVFYHTPQELKIDDEWRSYFLTPPGNLHIIQLFRNKVTSCLMKYWPDKEEISHVLHELRSFRENSGCYHGQSEYLTGKPPKCLKLESFCNKLSAFYRAKTNPGLWTRCKKMLKNFWFGEEFLEGFIESRNAVRVKEFSLRQTPTANSEVVEEIMKEVSKMVAL
ncbi:3' exoribonuclease [Trichuris trichiura]|uniref:3' exoribonuclease n=1 Tax=Trichuris trichiura TaxID=36087 RepID=A0A077ZB13_TRITR|nr:3' exoribonuclease [Trichuris trichiura]